MNERLFNQNTGRVLVTGANGFIGVKVVEALLQYGCTRLRLMVRPSSKISRLEELLKQHGAGKDIEWVKGDLISRDDCARAARGISIIYHLAAGFDKAFAGAFMNSALATRNLMDAFLESGQPNRFVNVSSFAVYSNLNLKRGALLDENSPLEDAPQERYDAYGFGKLKQEQLVMEYGKRFKLPYVILRPGMVFGPGKKELSGRVGIDTFGFFVHLGGSNQLPLTYVDNCADAIVLAGIKPGVEGEIFNVVDDELLSSRQFFKAYRSKVKGFSISLPYFAASGLSKMWENYSKRSKGQLPPAFNRRRCAAEWKGNRYTNRKIRERLGWKPKVDMKEAMNLFLGQYQS